MGTILLVLAAMFIISVAVLYVMALGVALVLETLGPITIVALVFAGLVIWGVLSTIFWALLIIFGRACINA
jgi:hypothetical protein